MPAVSPAAWVPMVTCTAPVLAPQDASAIWLEPSICRLNKPESVTGSQALLMVSVCDVETPKSAAQFMLAWMVISRGLSVPLQLPSQ